MAKTPVKRTKKAAATQGGEISKSEQVINHALFVRPHIDSLKDWKPADLSASLNEYMTACDVDGEPITTTGIAIIAGVSGRTLRRWMAMGQGGSNEGQFDKTIGAIQPVIVAIIKKAWDKVDHANEKLMLSSKPVGAIFRGKNMGWSDLQQVEHTGQVDVKVSSDFWTQALQAPPKKAVIVSETKELGDNSGGMQDAELVKPAKSIASKGK